MKKILIPFLITAVLVVVMFLMFDNLETYFTDLLKAAEQHALTFALLSIVVLASDILLPVPSSIVMYMNGFVLGWWWGAIISLVALMAGSVLGYYLGRFTARGAKAGSDDRAQYILAKYGDMAILISRGIPIIAESVCIVCGYNRMPFRNYILLNFIGYIPLCLLYAICGNLGYNQDIFLFSFGCSIVISALFWLIGKKYFSYDQAKNEKLAE